MYRWSFFEKNIITLFAVLSFIGLFVSCTAKKENQPTESAQTIASQMKEFEIKYIGDNARVGKSLGFLPQFDKNYTQNMFALQTNSEPYGLTVYYEPVGNIASKNMMPSDDMTTYANYLFDCIENLDYIAFAYRTSPSNNILEQPEYETLLKLDRP